MASQGLGTSTFSAARAIVVINQVTFGTVTSCSWQINYGVKEIRDLDRVVAREIAPSIYSVKFSFEGVKVISQDLEASGIIATPGNNYLIPYVSLAVIDRLTNAALVNIEASMIEEVSMQIPAKGITTFSFSGIGFLAATDQSTLDQENNPPKPVSPV